MGDVALVSFNAVDPDSFQFVTLTSLKEGTVLYFSDNGWSTSAGPGFRTNEGVMSYTVAEGGLPAGKVISWEGAVDGEWDKFPRALTLAQTKDQLFVTSTLADSVATTEDLVYAVHWGGSGAWDSEAGSSQTSADPTVLTGASPSPLALAFTHLSANIP